MKQPEELPVARKTLLKRTVRKIAPNRRLKGLKDPKFIERCRAEQAELVKLFDEK